jgi:hypothetical protein
VIARSLWSPPTLRVVDFVSLRDQEPYTRNPPAIEPHVADALIARLYAAHSVASLLQAILNRIQVPGERTGVLEDELTDAVGLVLGPRRLAP